jgi:hypothetical protein
MDFPHYNLIPKGYAANLEWRRNVLTEAANDPAFAASIKKMCAEDCLFYINGFAWTYDPRDQKVPNKPFITYSEFQDDAIEQVILAIDEGYDIAWPKSRTMGASWMGLSIFEWFWHFKNDLSFLLISRNEDYVDKKGNPKALFWKIDFIHRNQPRWLLPTGRHLGGKDPNRKLLHLENADTKSVIDGESTTGDAGRGDRRTAMFIDEHAAFALDDGFKVLKSSRDTSKCRIFNSTPQGGNNAFYEVVHNSSAKVYRMHWSKHPDYNKGLYSSEQVDGIYQLKRLDDFFGVCKTMRKEWDDPKDFIFPEEYPFILDGRMRSPWYDNECSRCVSDQEIAQELDIDFLGSDFQFFDQDFIMVLVREYCMPPMMKGHIRFDPKTLEPKGFEPDINGPLSLWFNVAGSGELLTDLSFFEDGKYGLGSDISLGTGASNSVTVIVDLTTGKKIASWKDSKTGPKDFCDITIALAKWANKGHMIWDASGGTGRVFTQHLLEERKYRNIYYRRSEGKVRERISDQPGYFLNAEDRAVLLDDYRSKLSKRAYINPSEAGMMETLQFVCEPGGKVSHSASLNSQDPTGARTAHGDEVIADALASRLLTLKKSEVTAEKKKAPWMSPAWRFEQEEIAKREAEIEDW